MRSGIAIAAVAAIAAAAIGIWESAPVIVGHLVLRASQPDAPMGLRRLKIGHDMAGGLDDPVKANALLAESLKTMLLSQLLGVRYTEARGAWREVVDALGAAERRYVAPAKGFALGPPAHAAAEVAEGLKYVSHVVRLALEVFLETDPSTSPRFVRMVGPHLKLLGDNPDAYYYITPVLPSLGAFF